jgi:hypothetical protein
MFYSFPQSMRRGVIPLFARFCPCIARMSNTLNGPSGTTKATHNLVKPGQVCINNCTPKIFSELAIALLIIHHK